MANKKETKQYKPLIIGGLIFYLIELVWFLYSQIINPITNGQPVEVSSIELAIILSIFFIAILLIYVLKGSRKIGKVIASIVIVSVFLFGILAPLFDAYLPFIWDVFQR